MEIEESIMEKLYMMAKKRKGKKISITLVTEEHYFYKTMEVQMGTC